MIERNLEMRLRGDCGRQDTVREKREVRGRVWVGKGWVHTTSSVGLWSVGGACEW